jgi:hypothetical protein
LFLLWRWPAGEGRFGDDFLRRAADQSLAGITANDPAEAVYLVNFEDADGAMLSPDARYEQHFTADGLPPVDAFWSLSDRAVSVRAGSGVHGHCPVA